MRRVNFTNEPAEKQIETEDAGSIITMVKLAIITRVVLWTLVESFVPSAAAAAAVSSIFLFCLLPQSWEMEAER